MKSKFFLIKVEGGVEPFTEGPFKTQASRDAAAKRLRALQDEDDAVFWANTDRKGRLVIGSYTSAFFSPATG